jgi:hypothetical protein
MAEQKEQVAALTKLWEELFPEFTQPGTRQFKVWLNRYDFEAVVAGLEKALQQEQRREQRYEEDQRNCIVGTACGTGPYIPAAPKPMTCEEIVKYASGVMQGIKTGRFKDEEC